MAVHPHGPYRIINNYIVIAEHFGDFVLEILRLNHKRIFLGFAGFGAVDIARDTRIQERACSDKRNHNNQCNNKFYDFFIHIETSLISNINLEHIRCAALSKRDSRRNNNDITFFDIARFLRNFNGVAEQLVRI